METEAARNRDVAGEIRRNMIVLAVSMAMSWAVIQLMAGLSAITLVELTGHTSLGGLAPAVVLVAWALASLAMGRLMDRWGRTIGIRIGFAIGIGGALLIYFGSSLPSLPAFVTGLTFIGVCGGAVNLARGAAADMYPPEHRARGISYVLLGAAAGAILSPLAFAPMLANARSDPNELATPWLVAAVLMGIGFVATFGIRLDPQKIARMGGGSPGSATVDAESPRPLRTIFQMPAVSPALLAAVVAQAIMVAFMSIVGLILVDGGYDLRAVSISMSVHFVGMFGLVLVAGRLVDQVGRQRSIVFGLLILVTGALVLLGSGELFAALIGMFAIGVGWDIAFVASTAVLADAARPTERARLLGFNDFVVTGGAAMTAALAGVVFGLIGLVPLVVIAVGVVVVPVVVTMSTARRLATSET